MAALLAELHVADHGSQLEVDLAGKAVEEFRVYTHDPSSLVYRHYEAMRKHQCVDFVQRMEAKHFGFNHARMSIREAFDILKGYVDSSDPDTNNPNLEHMLQAAEGARLAGKPDWMQFIALIHDMGKIMFRWGTREEGQNGDAASPQFALGGDTWVVGCAVPNCTVLPHLNTLNPDRSHPVYSTAHGVYSPHCGMMSLQYAFGHDEYMYRMVLHNAVGRQAAAFRQGEMAQATEEEAVAAAASSCPIPVEGLAMLRLHSCYPWHKGGAYKDFMSDTPYTVQVPLVGLQAKMPLHCPPDHSLLQSVLEFNQFDLYTKSHARPDEDPASDRSVEGLWKAYYGPLVDKFMPGVLEW